MYYMHMNTGKPSILNLKKRNLKQLYSTGELYVQF